MDGCNVQWCVCVFRWSRRLNTIFCLSHSDSGERRSQYVETYICWPAITHEQSLTKMWNTKRSSTINDDWNTLKSPMHEAAERTTVEQRRPRKITYVTLPGTEDVYGALQIANISSILYLLHACNYINTLGLCSVSPQSEDKLSWPLFYLPTPLLEWYRTASLLQR